MNETVRTYLAVHLAAILTSTILDIPMTSTQRIFVAKFIEMEMGFCRFNGKCAVVLPVPVSP